MGRPFTANGKCSAAVGLAKAALAESRTVRSTEDTAAIRTTVLSQNQMGLVLKLTQEGAQKKSASISGPV
jgi:hypothetical protein